MRVKAINASIIPYFYYVIKLGAKVFERLEKLFRIFLCSKEGKNCASPESMEELVFNSWLLFMRH